MSQVQILPLRFFFTNTMVVIYTRENCQYCSKLKIILDSFSVKYIQNKLDIDFDRQGFYTEFGQDATFPQVVIDGIIMGGCNDTIEYLTSIGCLQEEKDMECTL